MYAAGGKRLGKRREDFMTRTTAREIAIHLVYEQGFGDRSVDEILEITLNKNAFRHLSEDEPLYQDFPNDSQRKYIERVVRGVCAHGPELDEYISRYAIGWSFARIPRVAVAIMRVSMFEILYMPEIPNSASVNEAVEIAKRYEEPEVVAFLNGILGSFVRAEFPETPAAPGASAAPAEPEIPAAPEKAEE